MKTILTGIQPTGNGSPHLGNYFGAIKNINKYKNYNTFVMIADVHATTVDYIPSQLKQSCKITYAALVASGISPDIIFKQSSVPEQMELNSYIMNFATVGEMTRMTQYKDKSEKFNGFGLLSYPILMAADIIAYNSTHIPAGKDQHQHVQLTQELVRKLNNKFGYDLLNIPSIIIEDGCKIMDLQYPNKKMSKSSDNQNGIIYLIDDLDINIKKIKKAVTDSKPYIEGSLEEQSDGVKNLIQLISLFSNISNENIFNSVVNLRYSSLKEMLIEEVKNKLSPISINMKEILKDENSINNNLLKSSNRSRHYASETVNCIKHNLGF